MSSSDFFTNPENQKFLQDAKSLVPYYALASYKAALSGASVIAKYQGNRESLNTPGMKEDAKEFEHAVCVGNKMKSQYIAIAKRYGYDSDKIPSLRDVADYYHDGI